jgi:deazaflavin-dependent oxidoreductase (nitroreductase family)
LKVTPYIKPGFFTTRVFNPLVGFLAGRLGLSMKGARVLSVQGRKSGEWHSTPVNPLTYRGQRYLVAPRGETQWVRNIRVSRAARLTVGGKTEEVRVEEVPDHEKPPILRAYLQEWAWEVKQFCGYRGCSWWSGSSGWTASLSWNRVAGTLRTVRHALHLNCRYSGSRTGSRLHWRRPHVHGGPLLRMSCSSRRRR